MTHAYAGWTIEEGLAKDAPGARITAGKYDFSDLSQLLLSGGDDRILADPASGRNEYGTLAAPAADEIWLSSSTASCISEQGWAAAQVAQLSLLARSAAGRDAGAELCERTRQRLGGIFDVAPGNIVLGASGTDAEMIALAILERLFARPVTNIVVAPAETGSGVLKAAAGCHFRKQSCLGGTVADGRRLRGWEGADIEVVATDIRTAEGKLRPRSDVDYDIARHTESALVRGRSVILHVLDASKTGQPGVSRDLAAQLMELAPQRVQAVVDACQLRCPPEQLKSDVDRGFMVIATGSKFAGGPPFSAAILLPDGIVSNLQKAACPPAGLASYSALQDWPEALRNTFASSLAVSGNQQANIGAALRWMAAIDHLEQLADVAPALQTEIIARFAQLVGERADSCDFLAELSDEPKPDERARSIVTLLLFDPDGKPTGMKDAKEIHNELRSPLANDQAEDQGILRKVIHIGQPVAIGAGAALRVCASARHVADVAGRLAQGLPMTAAFEDVARDLDALFAKLRLIMNARRTASDE